MNRKPIVLAIFLCLLASGLIYYRASVLGYGMSEIGDEPGCFVLLEMDCVGHGGKVNVRLTLPLLTERQFILNENQVSSGFVYSVTTAEENRIGQWEAENLQEKDKIACSFLAQTEAKEYPLPDISLIEGQYPSALEMYLQPENRIQTKAPEILQKAKELSGGSENVPEIVRAVYDFLQKETTYKEFKGPTDAITTLKLREGSCNGKNRLFVALCRSLGIPARVAGGLILKSGAKRTTHSWTEVWIEGQWVPFCVVNDYFARIPAHYLELYKGDRALLTRTKSISFDYKWDITERLRTEEEVLRSNADSESNVLKNWARFKDVHISLNLLMIILTLPVGATLITFSRTVIGVRTFGTFMPALMAVAFRDTGLVYGIITFCIVVAVAQVALLLLDRLYILHIPKMAVLLTIVVMTILGLSTIALRTGHTQAAAVSLFPLAILTITAERFSISVAENGIKDTVSRFIYSLVVAAAAFEVMNLKALRQVLTAYPETLLFVIAFNILLGTWTGLRLTELSRFRHLRGGPL